MSVQNRDIEVQNEEIEKARLNLEEKAAQLAVSSKYKSEFLANMSHELRTPLNSLLILSKLLAENPEQNLTDKQVEFASTIHTAGADLLSLISDILDLTKVEAGKMEINAGLVELATMTEYVERAFGSVAEQKGLAFEVTTAPDAPASIFTDEQRVQQVLRNLLSNAFKFTEAGEVKLHVAGTDERAEDGTPYVISIAVSDTGIGVAQDKLRLIFEAFQQADGTTSRRYGGTGLGLSISREIVRMLGGEIRVRSTPGEGSTFEFLLPTYVEAPEPVQETPPPALSAGVVDDGAPSAVAAPAGVAARAMAAAAEIVLDVEGDGTEDAPAAPPDDRAQLSDADRVALIIDDDPESATRTLVQAREHGFRGVVAPRGNIGLSLAHDLSPDVIVLSVPIRGGAGILDQLKHHPRTRHVPVHVIAETSERHASLSAGAAGFLARPAYAEELAGMFDVVGAFLDRPVRQLLVVEDDEVARMSVSELVGAGDDVEVTAVGSSEEALAAIEERAFDCIVLDLKLPKMTGFALLDHLKEDERHRDVPVIIHTGKQLTRRDETKLRRYTDSIIVKDAGSPERLLAETSLFLHRPPSALPADSRRILEQLHSADAVLQGKRVMIVDDDVRNVFALTSALEPRGHERAVRRERPRGARVVGRRPRRRPRADGRDDARDGRPRDDARAAQGRALHRPAGDRADGEGDEGRPREVDRGGRVGLHHEARRHRAADLADAGVAVQVSTRRRPARRARCHADDHDDARERSRSTSCWRPSSAGTAMTSAATRSPRCAAGCGIASSPRGCATLSGLQERILHEPACMDRLLRDLSINVTEMFRDPSFYRALRERVFPLLRTHPFIRVWNAGCSTGEESLLAGDRAARGGAARAHAHLRDGHQRRRAAARGAPGRFRSSACSATPRTTCAPAARRRSPPTTPPTATARASTARSARGSSSPSTTSSPTAPSTSFTSSSAATS